MKLHKTDRRFNLYQYGFDCYIEFSKDDWSNYNRYVHYCRYNLGNEFWEFAGHVYTNGNWRGNAHHRGKPQCRRIYFRGEKYHTLLLMAMPLVDNKTFYL